MSAQGQPGARPRILVVDDDEAIRASLRRGLVFEGFDVALAADGEEALRCLRDAPPDLMVLDVTMPGVDGLEVVRRLRAVDDALPVVLLTARDTVPDRVAGLESGADDYLVKPFAFSELVAASASACAGGSRARSGSCATPICGSTPPPARRGGASGPCG